MARLLIHVEGQTEETFVNDVLAPHLYDHGYAQVSARLVGSARIRRQRGGIRAWTVVRRDVLNHLRQDRECLTTTMVDYYALPESGDGAWPGRQVAGTLPYAQKAMAVEIALLQDVVNSMGSSFDPRRFVPYVMMHEFEGMLFSDCERFGTAIGRPELAKDFQAIRDQFATPEEINDSSTTAPSKRIEALVAGYEKPLLGTLAALEIGLERIRAECPHFRAWLESLESMAKL
jgi:hypothetical protein